MKWRLAVAAWWLRSVPSNLRFWLLFRLKGVPEEWFIAYRDAYVAKVEAEKEAA